jgi:hypothetical protein
MVLTDTDVIINYLKGTEKTKQSLSQIGLINITNSLSKPTNPKSG